MIVFHHNDPDGYCSAFLVGDAYKNRELNIRYYSINYDMQFPFDIIEEDETVFIVDYSIKPEEMEKLLSITKNVVWIDHHISAIQKYEYFNKGYNIEGYRDTKYSGCVLTYMWLYNVEYQYVPYYIKLIGDYDTWQFKYAETKNFFKGLQYYNISPNSDIWENLKNDGDNENIIGELVSIGSILLKYDNKRNKDQVKETAFEIEYDGLKGIATNKLGGSVIFDSVKDIYDFMCAFSYNGKTKKWIVRLYSEKVEVLNIALKFDGGGHPKACGFQCDELPDFIIKH